MINSLNVLLILDAESSNSTQECSMICWLFRTLLTSEYRALPLNAIFDLFERTVGREQGLGRERRLQPSRCSPRARHWRLCIRHVLLTSPVFVRVLTPNVRFSHNRNQTNSGARILYDKKYTNLYIFTLEQTILFARNLKICGCEKKTFDHRIRNNYKIHFVVIYDSL